MKPSPLFCGIYQNKQNLLNRFKFSRRLIIIFFFSFSFWILSLPAPPFFLLPSRGTKGQETDEKGEHKTNPQNLETETNVTLLSHRAVILLCMCIITLKLFFTTFILLIFFNFSSLCLVFCILFPCLIALLDGFSLFSLYYILIFLLLLHPCSNNTQLFIYIIRM